MNKSISIDDEVAKRISHQAKKEKRNFSNMIEVMADYYLKNQK